MGLDSETPDPSKNIARHEKRINRLEDTLAQQNQQVNDLIAQVVQFQLEQGRRLDEQGRRLDEQGRRLDEQGRRFDELMEKFTTWNEEIRSWKTSTTQQIQAMWENLDGRLQTLEDKILSRLPPETMTT